MKHSRADIELSYTFSPNKYFLTFLFPANKKKYEKKVCGSFWCTSQYMYPWMPAPNLFNPFHTQIPLLGADVCIIAHPNSPYSQLHVNSLNHKILLPFLFCPSFRFALPPRFQKLGEGIILLSDTICILSVAMATISLPAHRLPVQHIRSHLVQIRLASSVFGSKRTEWNGARSTDIVHKLLWSALHSIVLSSMMYYWR